MCRLMIVKKILGAFTMLGLKKGDWIHQQHDCGVGLEKLVAKLEAWDIFRLSLLILSDVISMDTQYSTLELVLGISLRPSSFRLIRISWLGSFCLHINGIVRIAMCEEIAA